MNSPNGADGSTVVLTIPMRAEYVSIARLTAAGVANRLGFDIETIEDIKVSLSEVCNRIISTQCKSPGYDKAECKIVFNSNSDSLGMDFYVNNIESVDIFSSDEFPSEIIGIADMDLTEKKENAGQPADYCYENQLQLSLIHLLMDEFVVNPNESCLVSMKKFLD